MAEIITSYDLTWIFPDVPPAPDGSGPYGSGAIVLDFATAPSVGHAVQDLTELAALDYILRNNNEASYDHTSGQLTSHVQAGGKTQVRFVGSISGE